MLCYRLAVARRVLMVHDRPSRKEVLHKYCHPEALEVPDRICVHVFRDVHDIKQHAEHKVSYKCSECGYPSCLFAEYLAAAGIYSRCLHLLLVVQVAALEIPLAFIPFHKAIRVKVVKTGEDMV